MKAVLKMLHSSFHVKMMFFFKNVGNNFNVLLLIFLYNSHIFYNAYVLMHRLL